MTAFCASSTIFSRLSWRCCFAPLTSTSLTASAWSLGSTYLATVVSLFEGLSTGDCALAERARAKTKTVLFMRVVYTKPILGRVAPDKRANRRSGIQLEGGPGTCPVWRAGVSLFPCPKRSLYDENR